MEYDQEKQTEQQSVFQGRVSYHLSTFDNGQNNFLARTAAGRGERLYDRAPKEYGQLLTAEGALNLESFYKTRIAGSLTYGWLSQNDYVLESNTSAALVPWLVEPPALRVSPPRLLPRMLAGVTRPTTPWTLKYLVECL